MKYQTFESKPNRNNLDKVNNCDAVILMMITYIRLYFFLRFRRRLCGTESNHFQEIS